MIKRCIESYKEINNQSRDELAVAYLPAVKAMAYKLKERLPSSVETLDLISIGAEELIKLSRRYDEKLNDSFWGYARTRVYGSMLDYLRSLDVMSRGNRKLIKIIDLEVSRYVNEFSEEPSDEYLSKTLGEDVSKIKEARIAYSVSNVLPIDEQMSLYHEKDNILETIQQSELIEIIERILLELAEREQQVIQLYYFEELNLKEISQVLDITESRISQIHKSVLKKIRDKLGER